MRVCILGHGLSSLTLAKALVNQNIYVEIISFKKNQKISPSRTLGISKSNINFFNKNIINVEKLLWKLKKIEIYTDNLKNEKLLNFEKNGDQIFSIIKNHELHRVLEKNLIKSSYFKKRYLKNVNLSFLKDYNIIINCNYFNNFTNKYFGKKIIKEYDSTAYTTIISHEKILNNTAVQIFTKRGPLAFLPISNKETSIVYSVHNSVKRVNDINELIKQYNFKYKIKKLTKIENFELRSLNLRSYYHKNILAFGDLLHKIHPLAGQGFNMTIRDIKSLSNILEENIKLGIDDGEIIAKKFQEINKHKNFIYGFGIDVINSFFKFDSKLQNNLSGPIFKILKGNKFLNKYATFLSN